MGVERRHDLVSNTVEKPNAACTTTCTPHTSSQLVGAAPATQRVAAAQISRAMNKPHRFGRDALRVKTP